MKELSQEPVGVPWELINIPAFPAVATKAMQLLSGKDTRLLELYDLISTDAAFASETLRIANSPLFGFPTEVKSLMQAAMLLGFERLKGVAVTIGIRAYLSKLLSIPALRACWRHSLACATIAEEAATAARLDRDGAFTAGIMHDIGRVALAALYPEPYAKFLKALEKQPGDVLLEERKLFGVDHCQAGRSLVVAWRLPDEFLEITSRHHDANEQSDSSTTLLIHYSCRIADALGFQAVAPGLPQSYEQLLESIPESYRLRFTFDPKDLSGLIGRRIKAIEAS